MTTNHCVVCCLFVSFRNFIFQLRKISQDAGMPFHHEPQYVRYIQDRLGNNGLSIYHYIHPFINTVCPIGLLSVHLSTPSVQLDSYLSVYHVHFVHLGVERVEAVEPLFRQLCIELEGLQLILVVLPGKTPVYGT